jgi:anti-anti-sigma factor
MGEERRLIIPALLTEVTRACTFVEEAAQSAGLDERGVYHCQLAVDEWCTNVVEHGYGGQGDHASVIEVDCHADSDRLMITIIDNCPPFDPTTLSDPKTNQPVEDIKPGGLGWFLVKKIMDSVAYEYSDHHNRLSMIKLIQPGTYTLRAHQMTYPVHELRGHLWVVVPNGRLDSNTSSTLEATLRSQEEAGHHQIIIDMSDVTYLSSSGLKVMLSAHKRAHAKGGRLAIAGLKARVLEVFSISGFDALFTITETVQDAATILTRT